MKTESKPVCPWIDRYEMLRRHIVESRPIFAAAPLGAVLVIRAGIVNWMHQWAQASAPVSAETPLSPPCAATPAWQHELTLLLAQMTACQLAAVSP